MLNVNSVVVVSPTVVASPARQPWLDTLRGVAVVWMTVYHFSFDLNHFGWIHQDFYRSPVWTLQRTCILSLFLLCAGLGQAIAFNHKQPWPQFWRRWTQIAGCALLVSAGSWLVFPHSWIYFGVLHGMAIMILVSRLTAGWGRWLWLAGAVTLAVWWLAPFLHANWPPMEVFDVQALSWLGLASVKPITEDYVPLLPWMAVVWWGMALGQWTGTHSIFMRAFAGQRGANPLNWLGRWSLTWYVLHQPVIMGALMLLSTLR